MKPSANPARMMASEMDIQTLMEMSMPVGMVLAPPISIDVRRMNKERVLRDDATPFVLSWESGDKMLVIANRQAVRVIYAPDTEQDILLEWKNDKPRFVCGCKRQVTKLFFDGLRFVCQRCLESSVLPPMPTRRAKRIPSKTRLRILARDHFECVGCGGTEGGLMVKRACTCDFCDFNDPVYDANLYTICGVCHDLSRRGLAGVNALVDRHLALERLGEEADSLLGESDATRGLRPSCPNIDAGHDSGTGSDRGDATRAEAVSEKRTKNRQKRRYRVYIMLLAGCRTSEIAAQANVSRWTVWRRRKELPKLEKLMAPLRRMMRKAARRKDWGEARFWRKCLIRVGGNIDGEDKASGRDVREWKKHLEALRDEALGRKGTTNEATEEAATPAIL